MKQKELIVPMYLKEGRAVCSLKDTSVFMDGDAVWLAECCSNMGADGILLFDLSGDDAEHDKSVGLIKKITRAVDIPVYGGGNIRRMEDVKKLIYAGCRKVFLNYGKASNEELTHEVSGKFGKDKIMACARTKDELEMAVLNGDMLCGVVLLDPTLREAAEETVRKQMSHSVPDLYPVFGSDADSAFDRMSEVLSEEMTAGICAAVFTRPDYDFMELKHRLKEQGITVNTYESSMSWSEIQTGNDGLLPVVVQDYKTQEVLMVAYMNQEAFETTIRTGRMTYWSRSRQELWVKGLTSGHYQYVRELRIDCDSDTLLAKVSQVGAACHTGNRSCFYRTILKKEYDDTNPLNVFQDVFAVIEDRKIHPKEGSYTNYLFEKGIDKILKKVGEEATEIVIAAKNPDPEEIKYEISDFLYHVMVLMAERGVTWEDITEELAKR
ncbi:MAG: bifunctional phosphoribosyl-AMP cyclohydrolase/phosphoribosyl-ATP diphosphatase HisIE [Candidatus Choladocola sp.]|nr:bifunctional phosphoribosyl-AMP cyclohydrolase/phosphoribosyl-ATP diphosphatase HisIE [Candidatus Choladocola sp.]